MNDYSNSTIYVIYCNDNVKLDYIGSTKNYLLRRNNHKSDSKTSNFLLHKTIRENGGWENFTMTKIANVNCKSKEELNQIEEYYLKLFKTKLNTRKAKQTIEEQREYRRNYYNQKRKENREKYNEYQKNYRQLKK